MKETGLCRIIEMGPERARQYRFNENSGPRMVQWIGRFGYFIFSIPLLFLIFLGRNISRANIALCKFYLSSVLRRE